MNREKVIYILNNAFKGNSINGEMYYELLSDFLQTEHPKESSAILQLCISQPLLLGDTIETVINYFVNKFEICKLSLNGKILMYY